jgi:hypothetical protein
MPASHFSHFKHGHTIYYFVEEIFVEAAAWDIKP